MTTTNYNIIACDGGGIRGLITAMLLNDLVTNPPPGSSSNILKNVNLYAGTSTGGIIALGLACGISTADLVSLYAQDCGQIFTPYQPPSDAAAAARSRFQLSATESFPDELLFVKYTNVNLQQLISNTLKTQLNPNLPLSDLSAGVLVTTFMMSNTNNDPWGELALSNLPNSNYASVPIIDAAMCSSAAPIYFPPFAVSAITPNMWCADGGVVANNPSAFTLANVLESQILEQEKKDLSNVRMLSIGTGATVDFVPATIMDELPLGDWGILEWLNPIALAPEPTFPLIAGMFDGQSQIADFETGNVLGSSQYQRANPTLSETINLDDCGAIPLLKTVAQNYIGTQEWSNIKKWAYDNFV